jgi:hypothetical protein
MDSKPTLTIVERYRKMDMEDNEIKIARVADKKSVLWNRVAPVDG